MLLNLRLLSLFPRVSDLGGLSRGLVICISKAFADDGCGTGLGTALGDHGLESYSSCEAWSLEEHRSHLLKKVFAKTLITVITVWEFLQPHIPLISSFNETFTLFPFTATQYFLSY